MQHAQLVQIQRHQNAAGNQPSKLSRSTVSCPSPSPRSPLSPTPPVPPSTFPPICGLLHARYEYSSPYLPCPTQPSPTRRPRAEEAPQWLRADDDLDPQKGGACGVERGNKTSRLGNGWKGEGGEDGLGGGVNAPSTKHQAPSTTTHRWCCWRPTQKEKD